MAIVKCPACGNVMDVPQKSSATPWLLGCLVAVLAIPVVLSVVGLLAAIAIPSFVKARQTSQLNACVNNMRQLDAAKEQWALQASAVAGAQVGAADLSPYFVAEMSPRCPAGGDYTIHAIAQDPECSAHGTLAAPMPHR